MKNMLAAAAIGLASVTAGHAASLSSLVAGGTLTEGDVVFDAFYFEEAAVIDPSLGDFSVNPDNVAVTTTSTATTVSLVFSFDPAVAISAPGSLFELFIDFSATVSGSSRVLTAVTLGDGDLTATTDAFSEVSYFVGSIAGPEIDIFESVNPFETPSVTSKTSDSYALGGVAATGLFGLIEGEVFGDDATAGLSTYALTFELEGTPPTVIPLPAGLPLLLAGLAGLAALRRRRT